jgi:hypothetical protein
VCLEQANPRTTFSPTVEMLTLDALPAHECKPKQKTSATTHNRKSVTLTFGYLNKTELPTLQQSVSLNETCHVERTVSKIYIQLLLA